ncbi:hypothetical protein QOZ80_3BG0276210 [Eleusine coracana subsp. coracana]|nr:hypothetical protein QOZ80_3BG0276210 [Eleusine coracana subsp. coracana]
MADPVVVEADGNGGGNGRLQWTNAMSSFVLRKFVELVGQGVKTDKGFKEIHLNAVAKEVSAFSGLDVSGNHVYNHLRKWRARWVKVCNLKSISGSLWDDEAFVISLDPEHYKGHIKIIFGSGIATGKYAMGSNEALGHPTEHVHIDVENYQGVVADQKANEGKAADGIGADGKGSVGKPEPSGLGKRKRTMSDDDSALMNNLADAIWGFTAVVTESNHCAAPPGVYEACMCILESGVGRLSCSLLTILLATKQLA